MPLTAYSAPRPFSPAEVTVHYRNMQQATDESLQNAIMSADIPSVDILEQIKRWGLQLPSMSRRRYLEKELIKKYTNSSYLRTHLIFLENKLKEYIHILAQNQGFYSGDMYSTIVFLAKRGATSGHSKLYYEP